MYTPNKTTILKTVPLSQCETNHGYLNIPAGHVAVVTYADGKCDIHNPHSNRFTAKKYGFLFRLMDDSTRVHFIRTTPIELLFHCYVNGMRVTLTAKAAVDAFNTKKFLFNFVEAGNKTVSQNEIFHKLRGSVEAVLHRCIRSSYVPATDSRRHELFAEIFARYGLVLFSSSVSSDSCRREAY